MSKIFKTAVALAAVSVSSMAFAQTCASPGEIRSFHGSTLPVLEGTTCGAELGVDLGGVTLVHPAATYSFVAEGATGEIRTTSSDTISALITTDCNTAPMAAGNVINLDALNLVDGETYYVIFTSELIGQPDPQVCGEFSVSTDTLPVELQSFSVD